MSERKPFRYTDFVPKWMRDREEGDHVLDDTPALGNPDPYGENDAMSRPERRCVNCRHYEAHEEGSHGRKAGEGSCRRYPPLAPDSEMDWSRATAWGLPVVNGVKDWCGEFQPIDS